MSGLKVAPEEFRRIVATISDLATAYLASLESRHTFPQTSGKQGEELFGGPTPEHGMGPAALNGLEQVLAHSRPCGPRFYGYVLGSGEPVAAAADLLASVLNQNVTAWRSSPAAVTIERTVVNWLAQAIGCGGFVGSLTGGGSSANLMALAMAREAHTPANEQGSPQGMVYASSEVHMSIPKAVALLGFGRQNLRLVPVDDAYRMDIGELARMMRDDAAAGRKAAAVVASAGTVNTGSIDALAEVAAIAREHNAWFHVDGAYGALAAMAVPEKFAGLEQADSISLDPHKWLYQPLDCGCLLYRDRAAAQRAFSFTGDYARALSQDPQEGFAFFEESLELSRRFRALKLWLSFCYHGMAAFREAIRADLAHARLLSRLVEHTAELELLAPVELSAVCFRQRGGDNALQAALLKRVIERGRVYLSNATLRGRFALRACFVNHRTTEEDVREVVTEVLAAAKELR